MFQFLDNYINLEVDFFLTKKVLNYKQEIYGMAFFDNKCLEFKIHGGGFVPFDVELNDGKSKGSYYTCLEMIDFPKEKSKKIKKFLTFFLGDAKEVMEKYNQIEFFLKNKNKFDFYFTKENEIQFDIFKEVKASVSFVLEKNSKFHFDEQFPLFEKKNNSYISYSFQDESEFQEYDVFDSLMIKDMPIIFGKVLEHPKFKLKKLFF